MQQRNRTFSDWKKRKVTVSLHKSVTENCPHCDSDLGLVLSKLMLSKAISSKNFNLVKTLFPYSTTKRNARCKIWCQKCAQVNSEQRKLKTKMRPLRPGRNVAIAGRVSSASKLGSLVIQLKELAQLSNHLAGHASRAATAYKFVHNAGRCNIIRHKRRIKPL